MVKFEKTFVNYALGGLLILSILAFVIGFQNDTNVSERIIDEPLLNDSFIQLSESLSSSGSQSQTQRELFETEKPTAGFGSLILFSIVSSGKVFTGIVIGTFNVLIKLPMILFGIDPIISSILSAVLLVSIILGLWSLYKLGG